jgi:hypothetical protein
VQQLGVAGGDRQRGGEGLAGPGAVPLAQGQVDLGAQGRQAAGSAARACCTARKAAGMSPRSAWAVARMASTSARRVGGSPSAGMRWSSFSLLPNIISAWP